MFFPIVLAFWLAACTVAPDAVPDADAPPAPPAVDYEAALTRILADVATQGGFVDYGLLQSRYEADFDSVLASVEQYDVALLSTDEDKLAFFMNAYNVRILKNILDNPGAMNIEFEELFDDFFQTSFRVAGLNMTLNQLENGILRMKDVVDGQPVPAGLIAVRPSTLDPRIHVGLNCAAISCPRLRLEAFRPEVVHSQLDEALAEFADSSKLATAEGASFSVSSIIDWFGEDFDATGTPVGDYFLAVMNPTRSSYSAILDVFEGNDTAAIRQIIAGEIEYNFVYDWTINRVR